VEEQRFVVLDEELVELKFVVGIVGRYAIDVRSDLGDVCHPFLLYETIGIRDLVEVPVNGDWFVLSKRGWALRAMAQRQADDVFVPLYFIGGVGNNAIGVFGSWSGGT
jgi:hypothetical protein